MRGLVASLLRDGCDCWFDELKESGEDWPTWMARGLREAKHVLCVITPTYSERFRGEAPDDQGHGVAWEAGLIRKLLYQQKLESSAFVPVLLRSEERGEIPVELLGCTYFDLSATDGYEGLLRRIHDVPAFAAPLVGPAPRLGSKLVEPTFAAPVIVGPADFGSDGEVASADSSPESPLLSFPIGPMVRAHELPIEIVDLFAEHFEGRTKQAQACLASAMAARGAANPEAFSDRQIRVAPADLPDPAQGLRDYWITALLLAGQKSRRTLAALLLEQGAPQPWHARESSALVLTSFLAWLRSPAS